VVHRRVILRPGCRRLVDRKLQERRLRDRLELNREETFEEAA
jgi:hypothetical protein